jgi:hypothetical protein
MKRTPTAHDNRPPWLFAPLGVVDFDTYDTWGKSSCAISAVAAGVVRVRNCDDIVQDVPIAAGQFLWIQVQRVIVAGTTATGVCVFAN